MRELLELLVGALLPPVVDLVNARVKNSNAKYFLAIAVCLVVGVAFSYDKLNPYDVLASGAVVFAAAQTVYKTFWKDFGLRKTLQKKLK